MGPRLRGVVLPLLLFRDSCCTADTRQSVLCSREIVSPGLQQEAEGYKKRIRVLSVRDCGSKES